MKRSLLTLHLLLLAPVVLFSAQTLTLAPESALWLVGDSTLHPFTCRSSELRGSGQVETWEAVLQKGGLTEFDFVVPVTSLKSKEEKLDKNMYKALKTDLYPEITFHLSTYEVTASTRSSAASHVIAKGSLRIAGQEKPVTLELEASPQPNGLKAQGQYALLMSDYGIKPPTMMMGTIRVKDQVIIHFDLNLTSTK